ncbi:glycosyltransferase family 2 protein [Citrobacter braakii]|uniref:glycosyltransferase family 2 protein n=1 Tax=Citrobacter braakii TaxID=57706 RepID=UPI00115B75AF|nr:glycosyltransferase family 2 protein [Citrobacter braakii]
MPVSIVTPVYNRATLIGNLFQSLLKQDIYDFEWIVIDDGSTDNIKDVMHEFQLSSPFTIKFHQKENGGKPSAVNKGVKEASFDWIYIVDSDDFIPQDAISVILHDVIKAVDPYCAGMVYLKAFSDSGNIVGEKFRSNTLDYKCFSGVKGDKALVFKRDLLKKNPFPIFDNEKFMTEAYCWNKILDEHYLLANNKIIYLCEYLEDGLTHNYYSLLKKNKRGTLAFVTSNLLLKNINLNIYKQTIYHFSPVMNSENLNFIKSKVSLIRYYIFRMLLVFSSFKKNLLKVLKN